MVVGTCSSMEGVVTGMVVVGTCSSKKVGKLEAVVVESHHSVEKVETGNKEAVEMPKVEVGTRNNMEEVEMMVEVVVMTCSGLEVAESYSCMQGIVKIVVVAESCHSREEERTSKGAVVTCSSMAVVEMVKEAVEKCDSR